MPNSREISLGIDQVARTALFVADVQRTVLRMNDGNQSQLLSFAPYGFLHISSSQLSLLKFNGEYAEPTIGRYLLGNGYRTYSPILMRFNSPDRYSPFDKGGINAYCYVEGDPVNYSDPTGESLLGKVGRLLGVVKKVKTSSVAAKAIPAALKLAPKVSGQIVEKTLHKITPKDLERMGRLKGYVNKEMLVLPRNSPWANIDDVASFATKNVGALGITSTSRHQIKQLIQDGIQTSRSRLNQMRVQGQAKNPRTRGERSYLGDGNS